jgi:ABC-type uncharacterized transport system auxiliary subunit
VKRAATFAALLLAVGCAGGPAPQDHFYRLEVPPPQRTRMVLDGTLLVERPTTDALTRERALLHRDSESSVEVTPYKYHLWTDAPDQMVERAIIDYLREAGVAGEVASRRVDLNPRWVLDTRIARMEHMLSGPDRVVVEMDMRLSPATGSRPRLIKTYRVEQPVSGSDVEGAARAFGSAVGAILGQFVKDLEAGG